MNACGKFPSIRLASGSYSSRDQAQVVAQPEQPREERACLLRPAEQREVGRVPERAGQERALARRQPVDAHVLLVGLVAHDQAVPGQRRGRSPRSSRRRASSSAGRKPTSGISSRLASSRFEPYDCTNDPSSGSKPLAQTSAWISSRIARQLVDRPVASPLLGRADRAVERHPRHHLRMREVPVRAADLPDARIGLAPRLLQELEQVQPTAARRGRRPRARAPARS